MIISERCKDWVVGIFIRHNFLIIKMVVWFNKLMFDMDKDLVFAIMLFFAGFVFVLIVILTMFTRHMEKIYTKYNVPRSEGFGFMKK